MALHYKRMTSIAEAREYLAAGLLYENLSSSERPRWQLADKYTPQQLRNLEAYPEYDTWPITDYAILLED